MSLRRRGIGLSVGAALSLTSCGVLGLTGDCTSIGCTSGLTVHLPVLPVGAYTVEVFLTEIGDGESTLAYTCAVGVQCTQDVFFPDIVISHAIVRVTTAADSRVTTVPQVTYATSHPNGTHCPPECRKATIVAQLPA